MLRLSRNIYFTGFMGAGKSRVGEATAKSLGWRFVDTDRFIEEREGRTIPEIFAQQGEAAFRELESDVIREAGVLTGAVIATGGGAVLREENVTALKQNGKVFFLDRSPELLSPVEAFAAASRVPPEAASKRFSSSFCSELSFVGT